MGGAEPLAGAGTGLESALEEDDDASGFATLVLAPPSTAMKIELTMKSARDNATKTPVTARRLQNMIPPPKVGIHHYLQAKLK
jgi:hypothetical protein